MFCLSIKNSLNHRLEFNGVNESFTVERYWFTYLTIIVRGSNNLRLSKFGNWFKNTDVEKSPQLTNLEDSQDLQKPLELQKLNTENQKLSDRLKLAQKEIAQLQAQLQIGEGFRIELGETHAKLQIAEAEAQRYKKELFEGQKQLKLIQSQLTSTQQTLANFQNWEQQLKTPIQITNINKTLPKENFDTLWGFGIMSPEVNFTITTGAIAVKGWVLGKQAQAQTLKVDYNGMTLVETPVTLRRLRVAQRYPDIPQASDSGFEFSLSVVGIAGTTKLSLSAVLTDETTIALCDIILNPQLIESNET